MSLQESNVVFNNKRRRRRRFFMRHSKRMQSQIARPNHFNEYRKLFYMRGKNWKNTLRTNLEYDLFKKSENNGL